MRYFFIILSFILFTTSELQYSQIIPQDRFKILTNIGLEFERPFYFNHIIDVCQPPYNVYPTNVDWQTNVIGVNRALDSAKVKNGWKCIYFSQPGTYRFGRTISLTSAASNLVFKGLSSSAVILFFQLGSNVAHMFNLQGQATPVNYTKEIYET